jgi:hypothetical protein
VTTLFAVAGRGERDVWMLGEGREVLRWQGSRLDAGEDAGLRLRRRARARGGSSGRRGSSASSRRGSLGPRRRARDFSARVDAGSVRAMASPRPFAAVAVLLAASCASAPPSAQPPPRPPPVAAPAPAPPRPPGPSTLLEGPAEPIVDEAPPAPVFDEMPRRFEVVRTPRPVAAIVAVQGRSDRDAWLLTAEQELLRWKGTGLALVKLSDCSTTWHGPVGFVAHNVTLYRALAVLPKRISLLGKRQEYGGRGSWTSEVEARSTDDGRTWGCLQYGTLMNLPSMAGAAEIGLWGSFDGGPAWIDGRQAPLPEKAKQHREIAMAGAAANDLWLWSLGSEDVWHFDGVAWQPRPLPDGRVMDVWVEGPSAAWAVGAGLVHRWDPEARRWRKLPIVLPVDVGMVRAASAKEVWFFGKTSVHAWDGRALRRGAVPVKEIAAAWVSPGGDVWVAGADPSAHAQAQRDDGTVTVPAGIVLRAPAGQGAP